MDGFASYPNELIAFYLLEMMHYIFISICMWVTLICIWMHVCQQENCIPVVSACLLQILSEERVFIISQMKPPPLLFSITTIHGHSMHDEKTNLFKSPFHCKQEKRLTSLVVLCCMCGIHCGCSYEVDVVLELLRR